MPKSDSESPPNGGRFIMMSWMPSRSVLVRLTLIAMVGAVIGLLVFMPPGATASEDGGVVSETDDLDGDNVVDVVEANPEGDGLLSPGKVTIQSGADATEAVEVSGSSNNDKFGQSVKTHWDLNGDGHNDLVVGAPDDGTGVVYVFYGPFMNGEPDFDATAADLSFSAPQDGTHSFGKAASPVPDIDEDGTPDIAVLGRGPGSLGTEIDKTFFVSTQTGSMIYVMVDGALFDPWDLIRGYGEQASVETEIGLSEFVKGAAAGGGEPQEATEATGCIADLDDDLIVGFNDLSTLLGSWGACPAPPTECLGDLDSSGHVGFDDMVFLLGQWGPCDSDGDGLPDNWRLDDDDDGLPDGWEIEVGLSPAAADADDDPDGDGLSNTEEFETGTDPLSEDSDGDGTPDGAEINQGSIPTDATDGGAPLQPGDAAPFSFHISNWAEEPSLPATLLFQVGAHRIIAEVHDGSPPLPGGANGNGLMRTGIDHEVRIWRLSDIPECPPPCYFDPDIACWHSFIYINSSCYESFIDDPHGIIGEDVECQDPGGLVATVRADSTTGLSSANIITSPTSSIVCVGSTMSISVVDPNAECDYSWSNATPSKACFIESSTDEECPETPHVPSGTSTNLLITAPGLVKISISTSNCDCSMSHELTFRAIEGLSIVEAKGLYTPSGTYAPGFSGDGRVYTNRKFNDADPQAPVWEANSQYVDFRIAVDDPENVLDGLDVDAVWCLVDPDDPFNNDASQPWLESSVVHPLAGYKLDPEDYHPPDAEGNVQYNQATANDNRGDWDDPIWESIAGFEVNTEGEDPRPDAVTSITAGHSAVRMNAQDAGGDNYVLEVGLRVDGEQEVSCWTSTGMMTVWKLIQVDNSRMQSARELPFQALEPAYAPAFIEWRAAETSVVVDEDPFSDAPATSLEYCNQQFQEHAGQGGWFYVGAALRYSDEPENEQILQDGLVNNGIWGTNAILFGPSQHSTVFEPIGSHGGSIAMFPDFLIDPEADVQGVRFFNDDQTRSITFRARLRPPDILSNPGEWVDLRGVQDREPGDPADTDWLTVEDHGLPVDNMQGVTVQVITSDGQGTIVGFTPIQGIAWEIEQALGMTLIFDQWENGNPIAMEEVAKTLIHELGHALGMTHRCHNRTYNADGGSCVMNYNSDWVSRGAELEPWSGGDPVDSDFCAERLLFLRQTRLEDDSSAPGRQLGW